MHEPKKTARTEFILTHFLHNQFKKHFYKIYLDDQRVKQQPGPKLYLMNHSNWWDGLLIFYLNRTLIKEDSYAMMSKQGVEDFPFFGKIGAFTVDPGSPKDLLRSLKFAEKLLNQHKSVWIFPQGEEEHLEKRPFSFMGGPAYLIQKVEKVEIIYIAAYYTFRHDQRAELFIRINNSIGVQMAKGYNRESITLEMRHNLEELVDGVKEDIIQSRIDRFTLFKRGSKTMSEWLQWMKNPLNKRSKV